MIHCSVYRSCSYFKLALGQWRVKHAPVEVRATRGELEEEVGGVIEELLLCSCRVEHGQQLGESPEGV